MKTVAILVTAASLCAACGGGPVAEEANAPGGGADSEVTASAAAERPAASPAAPPAPAFREVTVPTGTTLRLQLRSAVASDSSRVEDTVRAELRDAVTVDGTTVLPAGTELVGTVTEVERSGRVKGLARVAYRFTSLTRSGERHAIATAPLAHQAEATKGEDAAKIAIGAGAGAAVGALLGGGDGAAKGAAIGGAGGTGVVLATRGEEVRLGPGANVTTRLTAPLTIRVAN